MVIPTPLPAIRYDVPSVRRVRDPLRPALWLVTPVKVDPLIVATTELFIAKVTVLFAPPSVIEIPVPDVRALSFEREESFPIVTNADVDGARFGAAIVTDPFDPVDRDMLLPAMR